ncbi:hypothetical protein PGB90_010633 [Kerria lacca]
MCMSDKHCLHFLVFISDEDEEKIPKPAHGSITRDSAQIIEDSPQFSTGLTRDMAEIREHKIHEGKTDETPDTEKKRNCVPD